MKREVVEIAELLVQFEEALLSVAKKHDKTLMPGYTHLQRAQPITFAHHLLAYFNMLQRDFRRLLGVWEGADIMPLGAGAGKVRTLCRSAPAPLQAQLSRLTVSLWQNS